MVVEDADEGESEGGGEGGVVTRRRVDYTYRIKSSSVGK